jgi:hypothetical protein
MSLSLEKLPSALTRMYNDLCKGMNYGVKRAEKNQEYIIDGFAAHVIVNMVRVVHSIPEGAEFCGGKLSEDMVKVTISPSDKKIEQAVASHFKSQIFPALFMAPEMPMFDEIVINDKKVV